MTLKQLTACDAKNMAALHADSFPRSWEALEMASHIKKDMCLGVDVNGALAAFIILSIAADQAEILTLATSPALRRQGFGQKLLKGAVLALQNKGVKDLFLEVAEDNAAAISLYRGAGFQPIGRRPGYYRREEGRIAALTFSKKI